MRALDSVFAQTWTDLEVIVVDDASSDDTLDRLARLDDPRLRFVQNPVNRGPAASRNTGVTHARGDFVAFLDSDDEWLPNKLTEQIDVFRNSNLNPGLVYSSVERVSPTGVKLIRANTRGMVCDKLLLKNKVAGSSSSVLIPRKILNELGGFDEQFPPREDLELWVRVAERYPLDYSEACGVKRHLDRDDRISRDYRGIERGWLSLYRKHIELIRKYDLEVEYLQRMSKLFESHNRAWPARVALNRAKRIAKRNSPLRRFWNRAD